MKPNLRILDKAKELINQQVWAAAPSDALSGRRSVADRLPISHISALASKVSYLK